MMSSRQQEDVLMAAMNILAAYRTTVRAKVREEVLEIDCSEDPLHGPTPAALEKYRDAIWEIQVARWALEIGLNNALRHAVLGKDELFCFSCRARIKKEEKACSICGWTWGSV